MFKFSDNLKIPRYNRVLKQRDSNMKPGPRVSFSPDTAEVQFDNILSLCETSTTKFLGEEKAKAIKTAKRIGPLLIELSENLGKISAFLGSILLTLLIKAV